MNSLQLIKLISIDIDSCFENADQLIEMGYEPWRSLETASTLDFLRRRYIREAVRDGASILAVAGASKLSPVAIRTIIDQNAHKI